MGGILGDFSGIIWEFLWIFGECGILALRLGMSGIVQRIVPRGIVNCVLSALKNGLNTKGSNYMFRQKM